MVDKFADAAVHFAYAKRFVEVHKESLTDRQCQQYSRISADYADELAGFRKAGVAAQGEFWNEVRAYSIAMIGAPGVPIPVHRPSNYWVTTGSEAEDIELRRILGLEIDEAHSQLIRRGGYSRSVLTPDRQIAQELPEKPRSEAN